MKSEWVNLDFYSTNKYTSPLTEISKTYFFNNLDNGDEKIGWI